jgi:hypothetical protein
MECALLPLVAACPFSAPIPVPNILATLHRTYRNPQRTRGRHGVTRPQGVHTHAPSFRM